MSILLTYTLVGSTNEYDPEIVIVDTKGQAAAYLERVVQSFKGFSLKDVTLQSIIMGEIIPNDYAEKIKPIVDNHIVSPTQPKNNKGKSAVITALAAHLNVNENQVIDAVKDKIK